MSNREYFRSRFRFDKKRYKIWEVITRYIQKEIPSNSVVLDLGAGYCSFINNIKGREKHALDVFKWINKYANNDVICHVQSSTNMKNIKKNYFDVVFASNFFEHLNRRDFEKTLFEVKRILKDKGKLIIIQPNFKYCYREYFDDYTHRLIFTETSLSDILMNNGFNIKKIIPRFLPFSIKSKLPKFLFLLKIYLYLPIKPFARQMLIIARNNKSK